MSDTVLGAITEWLEENPDATQEAKTRLDLGYLTYTVLRFPPQSFPLLRFGIKLMSSILLQSLLGVMNDLLQVADPESGGGFAMRGRNASDSALLLSTSKVLDDIFSTNQFTFPLGMQKQPPSYEDIPARPSPEPKRRREGRAKKSLSGGEDSTEVLSFLVINV